MIDPHPILSKPIQELVTSDEFLAMASKHNFKTLFDILRRPAHELLAMPLFTYRVYNELLNILSSYGLESKLIED